MAGTCRCDCHNGDGSEAACGKIHSLLLQGRRRQFELAIRSHLITSRSCRQLLWCRSLEKARHLVDLFQEEHNGHMDCVTAP
jgi:hypothetical protein